MPASDAIHPAAQQAAALLPSNRPPWKSCRLLLRSMTWDSMMSGDDVVARMGADWRGWLGGGVMWLPNFTA
jgi:hypothetical protein